eukprot:scaffold68683_cov29-Phaeocystis_antarctica.AAC.2
MLLAYEVDLRVRERLAQLAALVVAGGLHVREERQRHGQQKDHKGEGEQRLHLSRERDVLPEEPQGWLAARVEAGQQPG